MINSRLFSAVLIGAALFCVKPAHAATLFFDDMESGAGSWTATGLWHHQTDPQNIAVASTINPDLVSLPDSGYLPSAYSGSAAWWYGNASDGTIMGTWTADSQTSKNGGTSDESNTGTLVSEPIDLTSASAATLSFRHWWEVEGVDVDRYDMMTVAVSTDSGSSWTDVATLNPNNDVDGESWRPYSSGGLGQVGQWLYSTVDLSAYVGSTVQVKFNFDTVDSLYNGFRGWLIDDVKVTDVAAVKPSFDTQTQVASAECGGTSTGEIDTPAQFFVPSAQKVLITSDGNWLITPSGMEDYVASGTTGTGSVYLNAGFYTLWVNYTPDQACPNTVTDYATASLNGGAGQPTAQVGTVQTFYGENFVAGSTAGFIGGTSTASIAAATAADAVVVSSTEIQVTIPSGLSDGMYNLKITSPSGKNAVLANAITVTSVAAPDVVSVSPEEIDDAVATSLTITGIGFVDGAVVTVGGVPMTGLTTTDTEITGIVSVGGASGYQNIMVINPDGQIGKLVGGVYVDDNSATGYTPSGSQLTAPHKVHGVAVSSKRKHSAVVSWTAVSGATTYIITLKHGSTLVDTITTTNAHDKLTSLTKNHKYTVQVRAYNTYLGGTASKTVKFSTL